MREIKFRAWQRKLKQWQYFDLADLIAGYATEHKLWYERWSMYTGFKDLNGKEIYEGDIVLAKAIREYKTETRVSDVLRNNDGQWQVRELSDEEVNLYSHGLPLAWGGWKSFKIIGNIYENKDLLQ